MKTAVVLIILMMCSQGMADVGRAEQEYKELVAPQALRPTMDPPKVSFMDKFVSPVKAFVAKAVETYKASSPKSDAPKTSLSNFFSKKPANVDAVQPSASAEVKPIQYDKVEIPRGQALMKYKVVKLPTPEKFIMPKDLRTQEAKQAKALITVDPNKKPPAAPTFTAVTIPTLTEPQVQITQFDEMSVNELKLLRALVFLELQKNYKIALALLSDLLGNAKEMQSEVNYHLGLAARGLNLNSEFQYRMKQVFKDNDKAWKIRASSAMANFAIPGDLDTVPILDAQIQELNAPITNADQYQVNRARYYIKKNNPGLALAAVEEVPANSSLINEATFLKSIALYRAGQLKEALELQSQVLTNLLAHNPQSPLRSVSALTLGRMYFQSSQYKKAFDAYLKVDRKSSDFTQAMVEQAWTQILSEDYEGAAGNMFSLHTDFFKNTFAPESYVARTVGYLNLCQFGDGAKVVMDFNRKYSPLKTQMENYRTKTQTEALYYETIKQFASNPAAQVDGLPRPFVFELARDPGFQREQDKINSLEDQVAKYNQISLELVSLERTSIANQDKTRAKISELRRSLVKTKDINIKASASKELAYQEKRLVNFKVLQEIAKEARTALKGLRNQGIARIDNEKVTYKGRAAKALKDKFTQMLTMLSNNLDQSEVLQYELYSGAGEHIRYQAAGGEVKDKEHAELKPEDRKAMKWSFKGEIWEDEIGHYRSSLKNVCPQTDKKVRRVAEANK